MSVLAVGAVSERRWAWVWARGWRGAAACSELASQLANRRFPAPAPTVPPCLCTPAAAPSSASLRTWSSWGGGRWRASSASTTAPSSSPSRWPATSRRARHAALPLVLSLLCLSVACCCLRWLLKRASSCRRRRAALMVIALLRCAVPAGASFMPTPTPLHTRLPPSPQVRRLAERYFGGWQPSGRPASTCGAGGVEEPLPVRARRAKSGGRLRWTSCLCLCVYALLRTAQPPPAAPPLSLPPAACPPSRAQLPAAPPSQWEYRAQSVAGPAVLHAYYRPCVRSPDSLPLDLARHARRPDAVAASACCRHCCAVNAHRGGSAPGLSACRHHPPTHTCAATC